MAHLSYFYAIPMFPTTDHLQSLRLGKNYALGRPHWMKARNECK